jgi:ABC-type branched-subunit amino acid transport system permease subunit
MTGIYIALGLSYDLIVGRVGWLSLAHPSFFGVGAYVAGILSKSVGTTFLLNFVLAGIFCAVLAWLISKPIFRLKGISFAIGTLGLAMIVQLVVNNEIWLTNGPMCLTQVPRPVVSLPPLLQWHVSSLTDYYYLVLAIVLLVLLLYWRMTSFRLGRTFESIREDEVLARASGVDPWKYKALAFGTGAFIAGGVGVYWVHYLTIVCPTQLSVYMTNVLLIMLFLGGVGTMSGVILGAIVFTVVPEFLRIADQLRLVIYGTLLIVAITSMPEGVGGVARRWLGKFRLFTAGRPDAEVSATENEHRG